MQIKGCATGRHSDIKPGNNVALGGSHVRGQTASDPKLKKIEDFNAGKSDEKPLDLLKRALVAIGCSADDFDAAKAKLSEKFKDDEKEIQAEFCAEIGFGEEKVPAAIEALARFVAAKRDEWGFPRA